MIAGYFHPVLSRIRIALSQGRGAYITSLAASQIAPLIGAPIVSRLYSPEDFGVYGIYYAFTAVVASVSSLALHNAILLRNSGEPSFHAVVLSLAVTACFSLLLLLLTILFGVQISDNYFSAELAEIIYFLPITVFLSGVSMCLMSWAIRHNRFGLLARNKIILAVTTSVLQICIGIVGIGAIGFVLSNIVGTGLSVVLLLIPFFCSSRGIGFNPSFRSAVEVLTERRSLVFWLLPANLISSSCSFMPELLIGKIFGATLLGQFVLANRMLNFPIAFISVGLQDLFRQQAVAEFNSNGTCRRSFYRFLFLLFIVSLVVLLPIVLIIPYIFPIVFGSQWTEAGILIQAVAFLSIVRFISSPLSYIWIIQGQQRLDLLWQIGLLVLSLATLILPPLLDPEITLYSTLWICSLVIGAWYVLAIAVSYRLSGRSHHPCAQKAAH